MDIHHLDPKNSIYTREVKDIRSKLEHTPEVIFDLGGNVGGFSLRLAEYFPDAHVYTFEPVKVTFEKLNETVKDLTNVTTYNFGLSNQDRSDVPIGMPTIPKNKRHNYGRSTIHALEGEPIDHINLKRISSWCNSNNIFPDMMKIDVEGSEYNVLNDLKVSGLLENVKLIYIEINNTFDSAQKAKELLEEDYSIVGDSGPNPNNGEPLNYIFRRND